jgi:hypothetical protein
MLSVAEDSLGSVALDGDVLIHVIAASVEDPDETPELAEEVAALHFCDLPKLRETTSSLRKKLRAKRKGYNSDRLRLARGYRIINEQGATIAQINAELEKLKDSLKSAPLSLSEPAVPVITPDDIAHRLLKELVDRMDQDLHARRYRKMMCDFAFGFHAISLKASDFACDALSFPAVSTVLRRAELERIYVEKALAKKGIYCYQKIFKAIVPGKRFLRSRWCRRLWLLMQRP